MKTDIEIQEDVINELRWEPFLNSNEIGVAVTNGIVTLSGTVDLYSKKVMAEKAAKRVAGVKAVAEEIEVHLPDSHKRNDGDIAEAVLNALKWHSALQEDKLKVKVEAGIVTLEGEVDWSFQKDSARLMVENLSGVWGIVNNIKIAKKASPNDVKQKILSAFHRHASIDAEKIEVALSGSKVVLTGNVRSWPEKYDAEKAAWQAAGITEVENKLEVKREVPVL